MNSEKSNQILDWITQDRIPSDHNLTERVLKEAAHSPRKIPTPRMKMATSAVIAFVALILLSSVAYAVYRLIIDPGLQAVQDAGLVTNMKATAQSTILPTVLPAVPLSALIVAQSQTVEGVTMTLDWVYLDSTRLLFGIHFSTLPDSVSPGFPDVAVNGQPLGGDRQESKFLQSSLTQAIFLSNQVTQSDAMNKRVTLEVTIPLLRNQDDKETQAASFHFTVEDVPLYEGQTLGFQQTSAVSVNGVEMLLHSVRLTPDAVDAVVCPSPISSVFFSVDQAVLSGDGINEREAISVQPAEDTVAFCQKLSFDPVNSEDAGHLMLTVNKDWKFYIDQPSEGQIPGIKVISPLPTPQPVAAQAIDQVAMTLDWVFVDAKRIAFGYTISGLPDLPEVAIVGGTIAVSDAQGNQYSSEYGGESSLQRSPDQTGTLSGTWSTILRQLLTEDQVSLNIDVTLDGTHGNDWKYTIGNVNPATDPTAEMVEATPVVIPNNLVGTYHFEVTTKVYPVTTVHPDQAIEANGIQMELVQAELTPSYSSFILCYNKPSAEDWMISGNAVLTSGVEQASIQGYSLLSDNNHSMTGLPVTLPPSSITGENVRCAQVEFMLGHSNQARNITLTIDRLERSGPEAIPPAELEVALAKLREQGIEMTYTMSRGVGGGGGGPEYTKLPEGMTQNEAYNRFMDALGYRFPGPWIFTLKYQP